jgi:polyisoprenoid-binding protein YceI
MRTSSDYGWLASPNWPMTNIMKRYLYALCFACVTVTGCYDPTEGTVSAGGAAPKKGNIEVSHNDRQLALDAENTDMKWTGSNTVGQTPYGFFYQLSGKAVVDGRSQELKSVEVLIDMTSVQAMDKKLTKKLKENGFFEVKKYPAASFESTSITKGPRKDDKDGTTHVIEGNFQLRDVTKSIQIPVAIKVDPESFTLTSEFSINRKDYGVVYENSAEDALIRDGVVINLEITIPPKEKSAE